MVNICMNRKSNIFAIKLLKGTYVLYDIRKFTKMLLTIIKNNIYL